MNEMGLKVQPVAVTNNVNDRAIPEIFMRLYAQE